MKMWLKENRIFFHMFIFLFFYFILIMITSSPNIFPDSVRYVNYDLGFEQIFNRESNSGSFLIAAIFFLSASFENILFINGLFWLISSTGTLLLYKKYFVGEHKIVLNFFYVVISLVYISSFISSWITAILTESIAISLMVIFIFLSLGNIFHITKVPLNVIISIYLLLVIAKPFWSLIALFFFFCLTQITKQKVALVILLLGFLFSIFTISSISNDAYLDNGITKSGWYSLTRMISNEKNFNGYLVKDVARITSCDELDSLLKNNLKDYTNATFFLGYQEALTKCPYLIDIFNREDFLSNLPSLYLNPKLLMYSVKTLFFEAISLVNYSDNGFAVSLFAKVISFIFIPVSIISLFSFLTYYILNNNIFVSLKILLLTLALFLSGFFIIWIDGIEMGRHILPISISLSIISIFLFASNFFIKSNHD